MARKPRVEEVLKSVATSNQQIGYSIALIDAMNGPDASTFAGYTGQSVQKRLRSAKRELEQAEASMKLLVDSVSEAGVA